LNAHSTSTQPKTNDSPSGILLDDICSRLKQGFPSRCILLLKTRILSNDSAPKEEDQTIEEMSLCDLRSWFPHFGIAPKISRRVKRNPQKCKSIWNDTVFSCGHSDTFAVL